MPAQQVSHILGLPEFKQLVLYTGNVMRTTIVGRNKPQLKKSNTELIYAIIDTIKSSLYQGLPSYRYFSTDSLLEVPDLRHNSIISLDDRDDVEVTAKLFYLNDDILYPSYVDQSIDLLRKLLNVDFIDTFVLSTPSYSTSNEFYNTWKTLESYYEQGTINHLGVSEFSEEQLSQLLNNTDLHVKPTINQVHYSCCEIPNSFLSLAKKNNVELLYTGDCTDILSQKEFTSLLQTNGILAENKAISPRWVLKYDVFVKGRSVVADKGYIVIGDVNSD
ncbi:NADP-dependent oxidoreductase domain-containing protein [Cunninghamella echinulata]|nr:NADP-dependent oxidoreductase domain-containing protein [Cunninghamella echinulata]